MLTWNDAPVKFAGAVLGALVAASTATYKSASFIEDRYAHQDDLVLIEMRLNEKIESDRLNQVQQRIWKLEDRYGMDRVKWPEYAIEELRNLDNTKRALERRLMILDQKLIEGPSPSERAHTGTDR